VQRTNKYRLTKRIAEEIKPDATKQLFLRDTDVIGFCLCVYPSGRKTYFLQYRNQNQQTRRIKLGVHGPVTTECARQQAMRLLSRIYLGEDPSLEVLTTRDSRLEN